MRLFNNIFNINVGLELKRRYEVSSIQFTALILRQKFENAALFLGLTFTTHSKPSRKRSFSKTQLKSEEFENTGFSC